MRDFRETILKHGLSEARRMAATAAERVCVDAAWAMLEQPRNDLAFASRAVTTLPHKGGRGMTEWVRDADTDGTYIWRGGDFEGEPMGVPFGAKSRIILLHLLNEAIRTNSRTVTAGASMYEWARVVSSSSLGGMTYHMVSEHSRCVATCNLTVLGAPGQPQTLGPAPPIDSVVMHPRAPYGAAHPPNTARWALEFPEAIVINEQFFELFKAQAVPVRSSALRQLSNNGAAIDLYIRFATRLPALERPVLAKWADVALRYGSGYKNTRQLKPAVHDVLLLVLAVYPEAKVEILPDGLIMHPSPPPIDLDSLR